MTLGEAQTLGKIASTVDGGCSSCIAGVVERLNAAFPQFVWEVKEEEWYEPDPDFPEERDFGRTWYDTVVPRHAS